MKFDKITVIAVIIFILGTIICYKVTGIIK
jgi:hypothetical protein